jgi:GntR family transcriptional regulator, transcriptional repressor for pyruvate dehydrogenase complex
MRAQERRQATAGTEAGVFSLVKSEKFYMQIVAQIRGRIADGTLAAGERLPTERELCASFGASRASIREALSALEILGAIESRGRGKYIHVPAGDGEHADAEFRNRFFHDDSAFDLFEARLAIEPDMAALAAQRGTREDIRGLSAQLAVLEAIGRQVGAHPDRLDKAIEEYLEADRTFHLLIGKAAHNRVLDRFFSGIHHTLRRSHWRLLRRKVALSAPALKRLNREHASVLAAITEKNARLARSLMSRHLEDLQQALF